MRSSHIHRLSSFDTGPQSEEIEELLRFARSLDAHPDADRLLRSLPGELSSIVASNTTALIHMNGDGLSCYALESKKSVIEVEFEASQWQDEIDRLLSHHLQPVVFSPLDSKVTFPALFRSFANTETILYACFL